MKVVILSYFLGEYCLNLANAMSHQAETFLMLPRGLPDVHLASPGRLLRYRPFHRPQLRDAARQVLSVSGLVREIRSIDPDVLHVQGGHLWFNLALPLLRKYPLVLTIHDPRHHVGDRESRKTPQAVLDFGYRRADRVILHGEQLKRETVRHCRIRPEIIHVMPMVRQGADAAPSLGDEVGNTILFFGRIWEYKGLDYLIRAEPLITARVPDARIVIVGQGEDFARYRRMMAHPERFEIHNEAVWGARRDAFFRSSSLVVLPYIEATQSAVVPVAYSFGKPVVATTVGGLPEAVDHGSTGLLVPPRDEAALADAIVGLLQDKDLRRRMGEQARRKVDTEWAPETVARQTLDVYHLAIADRAAKRGTRAWGETVANPTGGGPNQGRGTA